MVLLYLMEQYISWIDGSPIIIVIDEEYTQFTMWKAWILIMQSKPCILVTYFSVLWSLIIPKDSSVCVNSIWFNIFFTDEKPKRLTICMCEFHLNQYFFYRKATDLTNFSQWKDHYLSEQNAIDSHINKFDGTVSSGISLMLNISFLRCWWTVQSTMASVIQYDITLATIFVGKM